MINSFDILGREPKLLLNKTTKYKTSFGGVVSILTMVLIGIFIVFFFIELFERKRTNVMYNRLSDPAPSVNITEFPFVIGITPGTRIPYKNADSLFKIIGSNGTTIPVEKCDINKHFGNYSSYFKDVPYLSDSYCLPYMKYDLTLSGVPGSVGQRFVNIDIKRCINGSTLDIYGQVQNSSNCVDYNTWYNTMLSAYISYGYLDYSIDHNNQNNPNVLIYKSSMYAISSTIFKRFYVSMKNVNYITDIGYVIEDPVVNNFTQLNSVDESMDLRNDVNGKFAQFTFVMSSDIDYYYRSYMKLQNTIANIGGVLKSAMFAANLIVTYINNVRYYAYIHSLVYLSNDEKVEHQDSMMKINIKKSQIDSHQIIMKLPAKIKENNLLKRPLNITFKDIICPTSCLKKESSIVVIMERFYTILSIDYILKKLNKYDNLLENEQIKDNFEFHEPKIQQISKFEMSNFPITIN